MSNDQAEKLFHELQSIKLALWAAILTVAVLFLGTRIIAIAFGPPPLSTISHQPPK